MAPCRVQADDGFFCSRHKPNVARSVDRQRERERDFSAGLYRVQRRSARLNSRAEYADIRDTAREGFGATVPVNGRPPGERFRVRNPNAQGGVSPFDRRWRRPDNERSGRMNLPRTASSVEYTITWKMPRSRCIVTSDVSSWMSLEGNVPDAPLAAVAHGRLSTSACTERSRPAR